MSTVKAKEISICIFTLAPTSRATAKPEEAAAYDAFAQVIWALRAKHGPNVPVYMDFCPLSVDTNALIVNQQGLDLSLLPAVQIFSRYDDDTTSQYFLKKDLADRFTGLNWKPEDVRPYVEALLYRRKPAEQSIMCKLLPPLCEVGGWIWLGAAIVATHNATQSRNVGRVAWGVVAGLTWEAWYKRGGLDQLTTAAGIGKYYDDVTIKPGSRVDQYWGSLIPSPSRYGVEDVTGKHYTSVQEAIKHFGLYSIEFGNWLNQEERLNFMYATLVTLRDMATVTRTNHNQMGLHKKLSLAFGSRGKGGRAAAFYQGAYQVINLTKTKGRGTFCHEYAHAVDDFLGRHSGWRSTRKQPDYMGKRSGSTAWLFEKVLDGVLWEENGNPSTYHIYLTNFGEYLNRRNEIFARICETFFQIEFAAAGIKNSWGGFMREDMPSKNLVARVAPELKKIFQKI